MFIIKDDSRISRKPTASEMPYCRPLIIKPEVECLALVAVPDGKEKSEGNDSTVKEMISKFEKSIVNPFSSLWKSVTSSGLFNSKEEGIKIEVKKNNLEGKK